jgi:hypothetical protein
MVRCDNSRPENAIVEGFDSLHFVRNGDDGGFIVEEWRDAI